MTPTTKKIFEREAAFILAEIVSHYPGLLDRKTEVDSADLVDSLSQHLFFNLSPESKRLLETLKIIECSSCGDQHRPAALYDPSSDRPTCKRCVDGFWEMMGEDPCGKDWRPY